MQWVKRLSRHLGFDEASIETQRGLIFTFGSYRLGAHKPGGDIGEKSGEEPRVTGQRGMGMGRWSKGLGVLIGDGIGSLLAADVLCVGPQHCSREAHFFGRDEWCLEQMLRTHADVREVQPVPGAFIPVLKVDLGGIDLDIIFAPLPMVMLPLHAHSPSSLPW